MKKEQALLLALTAVALLLFVLSFHHPRHYTSADFGIPPLQQPNCDALVEASSTPQISVSFTAADVAHARAAVQELIGKYGGHITSDSFNSYQGPSSGYSSQTNASFTATFDASPSAFLSELGVTLKKMGGMDSGYNYSDTANQPGYSAAAACIVSRQNIDADVLQLGILTDGMKGRNPDDVALLSQAVSGAKERLQADVSSATSYSVTPILPSVTVSINSKQ